MTLITMLISAALLFFLIRGAFRGLSGELAPLCGVAAGLSIVYGVYPYLQQGVDRFFTQADASNRLFYTTLGVVLLGAVGYFATSTIIRRLTRRCLPQPYDAIFGALFAGAKCFVFISLIAAVATLSKTWFKDRLEQRQENPLSAAAIDFWRTAYLPALSQVLPIPRSNAPTEAADAHP